MRPEASVATRWRRGFLAAFVLLLALKVAIAATLAPFGDEAFYWQESRHLAWGYSDLPPLTAWLIRFGEAVAGHGVFGMRWPFLLLGSALPWLLAAFAREAFGDRAVAWQAALLCLILPLAGTLGVMALPDVPLTVAGMLACWMLLRAMRRDRLRDWSVLGLALALCWLTHYRAAMFVFAGLAVLLFTPRGRALWRRRGLWIALALMALGLLPMLVSNWQLHGAGVSFQLWQRNPWRFHADALVQPLEQALACTPLLYGWLLWAAWRSVRARRLAPWDVIGMFGASFIVLYFGLGLFADDTRFRAHWPLPGYLPLLAALPLLWRPLHGRLARLGIVVALVLAVAMTGIGLGYLALAASPDGASLLDRFKAFPANFVGWRESAAATRRALARWPGVLVADNFMLAAELDFQYDGKRPIYVLDSPLNVEHGRAPQLAYWRRDGQALRADHPGATVLLVAEPTALRLRQRAGWQASLCTRLDALAPLGTIELYGGRKRFEFYRARVPVEAGTKSPACVTPPPVPWPATSGAAGS